MDDVRFDGLVRAFGSGTSRRGALGFLAAAAGLGLREVSAKGKQPRKGKRKKKGKKASETSPGTCTPNSACAQWCADVFGADTPAASQCTSAAATCEGPCAQCGPACQQPCDREVCGQICCPADESCCDDTCVDTQNDPANCGGCGDDCPERTGAHTPGCSAGTCTWPCDAGWADCNDDPSDGCEVPLGTPSNCLQCGDGCTGFADQCNNPVCGDSGCRAEPTNEDGSCNGNTGTCQSGSCVPKPCITADCDEGYRCDSDCCTFPLGTVTCCGGNGASCGGSCDCCGCSSDCFEGKCINAG